MPDYYYGRPSILDNLEDFSRFSRDGIRHFYLDSMINGAKDWIVRFVDNPRRPTRIRYRHRSKPFQILAQFSYDSKGLVTGFTLRSKVDGTWSPAWIGVTYNYSGNYVVSSSVSYLS